MAAQNMKIVALAGGVGAARFLTGLVRVAEPENLTAVVNTGDDFEWMGLTVCPDLDTLTYSFSGIANQEQGWGIQGDTVGCLARLGMLGGPSWFRVGDRDLATHLFRTQALRNGDGLARVTDEIRKRHGVSSRLLPMTEAAVRTMIHTAEGVLSFQDYFVRLQCKPEVREVEFRGIEGARPAPGVLSAIAECDLILVCPSNPFVSIEPILEVAGIRSALVRERDKVTAVTPIVAGRALKGPTATMMLARGLKVSASSVASMYCDFLSGFILDERDSRLANEIDQMGVRVQTANTIMDSDESKLELARRTLHFVEGKLR